MAKESLSLVWKLSIVRPGSEYGLEDRQISGKLKYYLSESDSRTIQIGSAAKSDILVSQAAPSHIFLQISANTFTIHAYQKFICHYQGKTHVVPKKKEIKIPLSEIAKNESIIFVAKIKDTSIKNIIQADRNLVSPGSPRYQYLTKKFGSIGKIREEDISLVYRAEVGPPLIIKVIKPEYSDLSKAKKFSYYADLSEKTQKIQAPVSEMIHCPEIDLYGCVLQHSPGEVLRNYVVRYKKLDVKYIIQIIANLVKLLAHFHSQQKIYGYISPDNFFIQEQGPCLLSLTLPEAGLARAHRLSTPNFTAPEQLACPKVADERADIFATGALLYFMVIGFPPFLCQNLPEYQQAIGKGLFSPQFPEDNRLGMQFRQLILRCLGQNPEQRLENIHEFWKIFQKITTFPHIKFSASSLELEATGTNGKITEESASRLPVRKHDNDSNVESFGSFRLEKKLGNGPYALVHRAFDLESNRVVSLKIFRNEDISNDIETGKLLAEAQTAFILKFPHIAEVYKTGKVDDRYYIASRYIEGVNLKQYRRQKTLSPKHALVFVRDIARALQHAHSRGIVHRDVKPTNIIIDKDDQAYLIDFGSSKNVEAKTTLKSGKMFGTLRYMAPELLDGYRASPLQDVYSLGAILYELLTGEMLIDGLSSMEIISKISTIEPNPRRLKPQIAGDAETICLKALEKKPINRYQSAGGLADDIDRFIECRPILSMPPNIWNSFYKRILRHQNLAITFTLSFLLLTLGLFYCVFVYTGAKKQRLLRDIEVHSRDLWQNAEEEYSRKVASLPKIPDSSGLSAESIRAERKILSQLHEKIEAEYSDYLLARVLPLSRRSLYADGNNCRPYVTEILQRVIDLSDDEGIREGLRMELMGLKGEKTESGVAEVTLRITPKENCYLYLFEGTKDGRKTLLPFDCEKRKAIPFLQENSREAREQFLRCQNLLWEGMFEMFAQDYLSARYCLIRSIEINPDYIDAYFLLCCLTSMPRVPNRFFGECETWKKKALGRIQHSKIPKNDKKKLTTCFNLNFIQHAAKIYSMLPQQKSTLPDHLLSVICVSANSPLKIGDRVIKIDEQSVLSSLELTEAVREHHEVECTIIRNWKIENLRLNTVFFHLPFQVREETPLLSIWGNTPLNFEKSASVYCFPKESSNKIVKDKIQLPVGDYLLLCQADGHIPVRYPFSVAIDPESGKLGAQSIALKMPVIPAGMEKTFRDMVFVPGDFIPSDQRHKNYSGCLIGRYEVTMEDWMKYLNAAFHVDSSGILGFRERDWPVSGITYRQIQDYFSWLNSGLPQYLKKSGFQFRLPTDKEWAAAARGSDNRSYPWGNYPNPKFCKVLSARKYLLRKEPIARSNPAFLSDESPFGVNDMGGGVSEYTENTSREINSLYAIKGAGWSDSCPLEIDYARYCCGTVVKTSSGFRICAGLDPLFKIK